MKVIERWSHTAVSSEETGARNEIEPPERPGRFWAGSRELKFLSDDQSLGRISAFDLEFQLLSPKLNCFRSLDRRTVPNAAISRCGIDGHGHSRVRCERTSGKSLGMRFGE